MKLLEITRILVCSSDCKITQRDIEATILWLCQDNVLESPAALKRVYRKLKSDVAYEEAPFD